ncbi:MAG: phosphoenolpyruvate carboxylase [Proteobacteria bacterium]|nr:phosphoenolpyruvate carboxylase [Pseudomonadota bacterium]
MSPSESATSPHPPIDERLDQDIALLTRVLDDAIGRLGGQGGHKLAHELRSRARDLRVGALVGGREAFAARFAEFDLDQLDLMARVSTLWFHLVNAAEEQHRIRVLRARDRDDSAPQGSIADGCRKLKEAGLGPDDMRALLSRLFIMPVLTAHPTEARRRTMIDHLAVIAEVLDTLDRSQLGAREKDHLLTRLKNTVVSLLGTEVSRASKPSPRDEIRTGLHVFEGTLVDVTPAVYRSFEDALARTYPGEAFDLPPFLIWGSWIGGDRDGNPYVTSDTTRYVLERQRVSVLERYRNDVERLMRELSISARPLAQQTRDANGLASLDASAVVDRDHLPEVAARVKRYRSREPWREKLWFMRARLDATITRGEAAYANVERYLEDLYVLRDSLIACGFGCLADSHLRDAIRRAEVFGFHLATLDLRQHSDVHERAVTELLALDGKRGYQELDEDARCSLLVETLEHTDFTPPARLTDLSPETREILATLDMVGRARRELGPRACERYIVSFTRSVSDLLEVLFLIRAARLSPGELRPVPLLEQLEDLDRAGEIAESMLASRPIRAALGGELEVMIGYSDAGKQIGYFASAVALRRAQLALAGVAERRGVALTIFHGRGGAIGRGGGPANQAIRAQPPAAVRGRIRVTEQGETVTARYSRVEIAHRDLEQMVNAVLVAAADERTPTTGDEIEALNNLLDRAGEKAKASYTSLLDDPDRLARYALSATPMQQITKLPIGSRPASRRPGLSFEDLRAIPWVFSWNQSRHGLPGWFGLGSALHVIIDSEGVDRARELFRTSPFFRALINNAQLALSRADISVARNYAELADSDARQVFDLIEREHQLTVGHILDVVDRQQLLGNRPHLLATIWRRNPVVDVLSHTQIELLRRLSAAATSDRGPDHSSPPDASADMERIRAILFVTINGIAAGLQTAG